MTVSWQDDPGAPPDRDGAARWADVRVLDVRLRFRHVPFSTPLVLSSGPITELTEVVVEVDVCNRRGDVATGCGSVLLSHPWIWGHVPAGPGQDTPAARDAVLRDVVDGLRTALLAVDEPADPLRLGTWLAVAAERELGRIRRERGLTHPVPRLAGPICAGPFDTALHDAWGRAAGGSAYPRYTAEYLGADLATYLGPAFAGYHPADFLRTTPRPRLSVQHVVGVDDPLGPDEATDGRMPLTEWIARDGVRWLKLKLAGRDPEADARRIRDVHRVATAALAERGVDPRRLRLSLDPNEAYSEPGELHAVLHRLTRHAPAARDAVVYAEQPFPRSTRARTAALAEVTDDLPVLADESLVWAAELDELAAAGWSGVAVKAARGHTQALLAYCWARRHGRFTAVQDLTSVGHALLHSAALASWLDCSVPAFECNSRQYAPAGNTGPAGRLVVREGEIELGELPGKGVL